jgi:glycosyltransferase involved in cell wall biosynthesis
MILGIEASNIQSGGGLTHLREIIRHADPENHGFTKVLIWSKEHTLNLLEDKPWLVKHTHPMMNRSLLHSFLFQMFVLTGLARKEKVDVLFVPGGTFLGSFSNIVSMSQNMLPFEKEEALRFRSFTTRLRFAILRLTQSYTFKKSKGVIFLTDYARRYIENTIRINGFKKKISHGIGFRFMHPPKKQKTILEYSFEHPFKLLYVSIVTMYKHQWNVAEAVLRLREEGFAVQLDLVGAKVDEAYSKLDRVLINDKHGVVKYRGLVPYEELDKVYKEVDGFVFASSCENQPIIMLEAMSAGLPIACSNKGPMPEVLKENGFYFNPLDADSIYRTLKEFLLNKELRQQYAEQAYTAAVGFTWKNCSDNTFEFLAEMG